MKLSKKAFISLSSVGLCLLSVNCFADEFQGYITLADKLTTCTPVKMDLPDPIVAGTDTWEIKGLVQGNCNFSQSVNAKEVNIHETIDCVFPLQDMKVLAAEIRELAGPPTVNPPPSEAQPLMRKYCKNR